jgi:hypothetical protein
MAGAVNDLPSVMPSQVEVAAADQAAAVEAPAGQAVAAADESAAVAALGGLWVNPAQIQDDDEDGWF